MRLRKIAGAEEAIENSPFCVKEPEQYRGKWNEFFGNDRPIYLEIGMGKGRFLRTHAAMHPEINYLGIELYSTVLYRAVQKMDEEPLDNLRFLCIHAEHLTEIFAEGEIARIYLNFSDPWPKERHAKRRLTSPAYLERYDQILKKDGTIEFKTDNRALFEFSLEAVSQSKKWRLLASTYDLHHEPALSEGNVLTEYEEKFLALHQPIHKLILTRDP